MNAKNIRVSVYCSPTEAEAFKEKLQLFLPAEVALQEEVLSPESEAGVFTETLVSLSALLAKQGDTSELLEKLFGGLRKTDLKKLASELDSRLDDSCNFYLRLGKKDFMDDLLVIREKDPLHFRIKVEVYPAKREKAALELLKFLEEKASKVRQT